jgi:flagellar basal-body rod protein FlgC
MQKFCFLLLLLTKTAQAQVAYIVPKNPSNIDNLQAASKIAYSGIEAQSNRMKIISQNIANSEVTGSTPDGTPYRRKIIFFQEKLDPKTNAKIVVVKDVQEDKSDFILKYQPNHPAADDKGYVKYPNVNVQVELADGQEAKRAISVNANSMDMIKSIQFTILDLIKH